MVEKNTSALWNRRNGVQRRAHLSKDFIQPLKRPMEVNLNPAWSTSNILTMVLCSPALKRNRQQRKSLLLNSQQSTPTLTIKKLNCKNTKSTLNWTTTENQSAFTTILKENSCITQSYKLLINNRICDTDPWCQIYISQCFEIFKGHRLWSFYKESFKGFGGFCCCLFFIYCSNHIKPLSLKVRN